MVGREEEFKVSVFGWMGVNVPAKVLICAHLCTQTDSLQDLSSSVSARPLFGAADDMARALLATPKPTPKPKLQPQGKHDELTDSQVQQGFEVRGLVLDPAKVIVELSWSPTQVSFLVFIRAYI